MPSEKYYSIKSMSQQYDIPECTLRTWVHRGRLPYVKIGKLVRIPESGIREKMQSKRKTRSA